MNLMDLKNGRLGQFKARRVTGIRERRELLWEDLKHGFGARRAIDRVAPAITVGNGMRTLAVAGAFAAAFALGHRGTSASGSHNATEFPGAPLIARQLATAPAIGTLRTATSSQHALPPTSTRTRNSTSASVHRQATPPVVTPPAAPEAAPAARESAPVSGSGSPGPAPVRAAPAPVHAPAPVPHNSQSGGEERSFYNSG